MSDLIAVYTALAYTYALGAIPIAIAILYERMATDKN